MPSVDEHYRPHRGEYDPGVYRVVGVPEDVTLLRVADVDGRRAHTGEISHVPVDALETDFEVVDDPDAGFSPVALVWNQLQGLYWQVRKFF